MSAGAIAGAVTPTQVPTNRFAELDSQDFLRVMLEELSNQDPFEPTDSAALLEQMSSLRNIETQLGLQEKLESLVLQNEVASAGGLIGRHVAGLDAANESVGGTVVAVQVANGATSLQLDNGATLDVDRVTRIGGDDAAITRNGEPLDLTSLVGQLVEGTNTNQVPVGGPVASVAMTEAGPVVHLQDGSNLPLSNVTTVIDPQQPGEEVGRLIGRQVTYRDADDRAATARVVGVEVEADGVRLALTSGASVDLARILSVGA